MYVRGGIMSYAHIFCCLRRLRFHYFFGQKIRKLPQITYSLSKVEVMASRFPFGELVADEV